LAAHDRCLSKWYDLPAATHEQLVSFLDRVVANWSESEFRDVGVRLHVRIFRPNGPNVRIVLPPAYNVSDTRTLNANIAAVKVAPRDAQIFWAFPAPTDPANSSVRQDIIAACGVAERTTGVMTKCDIVRAEFDTTAATVISRKLEALRTDRPQLGGGWIAVANACSMKEATVAWEAAGKPEGELWRFKRENTLAREKATFARIHREAERAAVVNGDGVHLANSGSRAMQHHVQFVIHRHAAGNFASDPAPD